MPTIKDFKDFVRDCCVKEEWYDLKEKAMSSMTNKKLFLVVCQLLLILFLFREAFSYDSVDLFKKPATDIDIVMCRFLCAVFMHISLSDELVQSFHMMKYALNHPWKFYSWS